MNQDKIKELMDKGLTLQVIADEIGTTRAKLKHFLRKIGLKSNNYRKLPVPITKEDLLKLISLNHSTYEMAKALNCSQCNVRHWLKRFSLKSKKVKGNLRNSEGNVDPIKANNTHKKCPKCEKLLEFNKDNFYVEKSGRIQSWCSACSDQALIIRQRTKKLECLNYLGGKCVVCNYDKYQGALEFHHIDPKKKSFAIGTIKTCSMEKLKPELDKCVILCSNCHKEFHGGLIKLE